MEATFKQGILENRMPMPGKPVALGNLMTGYLSGGDDEEIKCGFIVI